MKDYAALLRFAGLMLEAHRDELSDIDGGTAQDAMVACGLLEQLTVTKPCGENCDCAYSDDFPTECCFETDLARRARKAVKGKR